MKSLQGRLHLGLGLALSLLMLVLWWITTTGLTHIGEQMVTSRMAHDGEALLASLQKDPDGQWQLKDTQVGHIYQRIFSGHYYLIEIEKNTSESTNNQQLRSRSLWDFNLKNSVQRYTNTPVKNYHIGPDNQPLLSWHADFIVGQQTVHILVAEDISPLHESLEQFTQLFAAACVLMLVILLLLQRWLVTRSFSSLNRVAVELESLSEGEITQLTEEVPQEIKPLVEEVNRLLQLLSQRLQRSRNAMGNLAHSLKHPLNLLMQLAAQQPTGSDIKEELNEQTQQIHQLIERELKRARIAGAGLPGQHFDPNEELPALVDVLERVYQDKLLNIDYEIDQACEYSADRNDMLELLGNLLDNACKWCNQVVLCEISCDQGLTIVIQDDGVGCDEEQLALLTERGVRIDESVQGSGLGLAIVKDIVALYQGELEFEASEFGGLKVVVRLP